jgi:lipopolysaccharide export system protein LptC
VDRKHLIVMAAVILFAALLWWLSDLIRLPQTAVLHKPVDAPDYVMEKLHATQTDRSGKISYRLTAGQLKHYPLRHESVLDQPVLTQYESNGTIIVTRADRARLPDNGREIHMYDNVHITERRKGRLISDVTAQRTDVLLHQPVPVTGGDR